MEPDQCSTVNYSDNNCVFCRIVKGTDAEGADTEILCQDEECVCFRDIDPAAPHHYLVVPRRHIEDVTQLSSEHAPLVVRMANMGLTALQANHFNDLNDSR
ncbi:histidine triad nucleotide-binding protein 3-like [Clupea harengus]|uniref:Histidine triad nucleotide-binding protein 3-like n=1 Tax=Clupea harengus TaxID=7950 RepID=A0A6P8GP40_CLUHA|nr:histidine triad nucleotide-binding protein 3-like [Clupea harengus]